MDVSFLDKVPWQLSQGLYHAAAHFGREAFYILRPAEPYICIGAHQSPAQELDLAYARGRGIPILRREVGGGAVYLDGDQLFYQFVLRKDHPGLPANKEDLYRWLLQPVVETYRQFGVDARFHPVNDILAQGRKVSGNGAGEIEGMIVLVGNFILDFDYEVMARVLRVPDEKFRDKVYKTLSENLSTFKRETGTAPSIAELAAALVPRVAALLGPLIPRAEIDPDLMAKAYELAGRMSSDTWLYENERRLLEIEEVKIRAGVTVIRRVVKLPGGLVRLWAVNDEGGLRSVHIGGDFFIFPPGALEGLEQALEGAPAKGDAAEGAGISQIEERIREFFESHQVEMPGITPGDLAGVVMG